MIKERTEINDHFNPRTYKLTDLVTGEEIPVDIFMEKHSKSRWQKAYAKTLAEYIRCGSGRSIELLAYILEKKDGNNMLFKSQRELAKELNMSTKIISTTITALKDKLLLKQIKPGVFMLDPQCISSGDKVKGVMLMRSWEDCCKP